MPEKFIVLDFLSNGHPADPRPLHLKDPVAQVVSEDFLVLLEISPNPVWKPTLHELVQNDDRVKIRRVVGRVDYARLTNTAKNELENVVAEIVARNEKKFVDFFNKAYPLTTRQHSLELLPGIGKKHMWEILDRRKEKQFEGYADLQARIKLLPDPKKTVVKRILLELQDADKYYLFVQPPVSKLRDRW
jgi:putative nucleotide binding protein